MVLSKFCTLTVVRETSSTYPSAPYFAIVTQSPGRSMSFAESCTPATKPKMLSLNININTAADAPSPASIVAAFWSIRMLMMRMMPTAIASKSTIW